MPALPAQWFSAYVRALPGVRAFLATVASEKASADLIPASGDQDHTSSPSASATLVSRDQCVHRIPLPTSVTIAKRPSCGAGCAEIKHIFLKNGNAIFRKIS